MNNIRQLKIFIEVATTKNMSAAASKFFISQPTISQVIRDLEAHYQTKFFDRVSQKLYITPSGQFFLEHAKDIVARYDAMEAEMFRISKVAPFRIGATHLLEIKLFTEIMDSLNFRCPTGDYSILSASDNVLEEKLLNAELDVAFIAGMARNNDLIHIPVIEDTLSLICPHTHDLYSRESLSVADLNNHRFALNESGSSPRKALDAMIGRAVLDIGRCWETPTTDVIKKSVLNHNSLSLTSTRLFSQEIMDGSVHAYVADDSINDLNIYLVYPKQKEVTDAMKALKFICEHLDAEPLPAKEFMRRLSF